MDDNFWWKRHPWRCIQTNLREIDMEDICAETYVETLKGFSANIAIINVGGIIASYPTKLDSHFQSEYLHGDSLKQIIGRCHEEDIRVIARMDFSKIRHQVFERHPDWAYRTADGKIVNYNGDVHTCSCSEYQLDYSYQIVGEVLDQLPIDGIMFNLGGFNEHDYSYNEYGICHCDRCREKFRQAFGLDLPRTKDMGDETYRKYLLFKSQVIRKSTTRMARFIKTRRPDVAVNRFDFKRLESNTEYRRPLPFFQYSASSNNRVARGVSGRLRCSNASVDFIGYFYRHVAVNAQCQKLRLYQNLANSGNLDYYLIGRPDNHLDRTGFEAVRDVYRFHERNEESYRGPFDSPASILLVKSTIWGRKEEERGWVRALTENHLLFDEVLEEDLCGASLDRYTTIVIPDIPRISGSVERQLEQFAERGGTVIVVGESGIYDEEYNIRSLPFPRLLGRSAIIGTDHSMVSSMLLDNTHDQTFSHMVDTDVLMLGDSYIHATYTADTKRCLSLVPPHDFGPPERCYFTKVTDEPGVTVHEIGNGHGVFVPWYPGTLYLREGYDNTLFFLQDLLLQIAGEKPVAKDASPMVEVTYLQSRDKQFSLVQLVNGTGHFGTSFFRPVPIEGIAVSLPCPLPVTGARSLVTGSPIPVIREAGKVSFVVLRLDEFESIRLEHR